MADTTVNTTATTGSTVATSAIIQCGRSGQSMCTLCDLIKGFQNIIKYIMGIAIVVALASFTWSGSVYVTSFGDPKSIEAAKGGMKNALIGIAIILTAWILVNTVLFFLGAKQNLGIQNVTAWGNFECAAGVR